tara:strand:- start:188 stop:733 length:546 start_codon:yes stop_codon:yes gene_type:complete
MIPKLDSLNAQEVLKDGGIIIYPTEGIYGIGCDAFNQNSVNKVVTIKGRSAGKSFIVICSDVIQLNTIIDHDYMNYQELLAKDFITWIVPAHEKCPPWLTMENTVAVRITSHPVIDNLCKGLNGPIISTSANYSDHSYINDIKKIEVMFDKKVDYIVEGKLGGEVKSSTIKDIVTKEVLRN